MAREELKWQNIDADDLPAAVKKSIDAVIDDFGRTINPLLLGSITTPPVLGSISTSAMWQPLGKV